MPTVFVPIRGFINLRADRAAKSRGSGLLLAPGHATIVTANKPIEMPFAKARKKGKKKTFKLNI